MSTLATEIVRIDPTGRPTLVARRGAGYRSWVQIVNVGAIGVYLGQQTVTPNAGYLLMPTDDISVAVDDALYGCTNGATLPADAFPGVLHVITGFSDTPTPS